jgi:chemotaxis protein histidine kinase CheA
VYPETSFSPKAADHRIAAPPADPQLAATAAAWRAANTDLGPDSFKLNVAVVKYQRGGQTLYKAMPNIPGEVAKAGHSEVQLVTWLMSSDPRWADTEILQFYTERRPCNECSPMLEVVREHMKKSLNRPAAELKDFPVYHSVETDNINGTSRSTELQVKYLGEKRAEADRRNDAAVARRAQASAAATRAKTTKTAEAVDDAERAEAAAKRAERAAEKARESADAEDRSKAKTPDPKAKTPDPKAKTPDPKAKTPDPKAKTALDPKAKTPDPKAKAPDTKAKTALDPKAKTPDPKAKTALDPKAKAPDTKAKTALDPKAKAPDPKAKSTPDPKTTVDPPGTGTASAVAKQLPAVAKHALEVKLGQAKAQLMNVVRANAQDPGLAAAVKTIDTALEVQDFIANPRRYAAGAVKDVLIQAVFSHFAGVLRDQRVKFDATYPDVGSVEKDSAGVSIDDYRRSYEAARRALLTPDATKAFVYAGAIVGTRPGSPEEARNVRQADELLAKMPGRAPFVKAYGEARFTYSVKLGAWYLELEELKDQVSRRAAVLAPELHRRAAGLSKAGAILDDYAQELNDSPFIYMPIAGEVVMMAAYELSNLGQGFGGIAAGLEEFARQVENREQEYGSAMSALDKEGKRIAAASP